MTPQCPYHHYHHRKTQRRCKHALITKCNYQCGIASVHSHCGQVHRDWITFLLTVSISLRPNEVIRFLSISAVKLRKVMFYQFISLAEEMDQSEAHQRLARQILNERRELCEQMKAIADQLKKCSSRALAVDRVGSKIQTGSSALILGGLVTSKQQVDRPGLSLGLTAAGMTAGVVGAILCSGADLGGFFATRRALQKLIDRLDQHHRSLVRMLQLRGDEQYAVATKRFRWILDQLIALNQNGFVDIFVKLGWTRSASHEGSCNIPFLLDPRPIGSVVKCIVRSAKYVQVSRKVIWALLAYRIAGPEVAASLPDTPLTMSDSARRTATVVAAVVFLADYVRMLKIGRLKSDDLPAIQALNSLSNTVQTI